MATGFFEIDLLSPSSCVTSKPNEPTGCKDDWNFICRFGRGGFHPG